MVDVIVYKFSPYGLVFIHDNSLGYALGFIIYHIKHERVFVSYIWLIGELLRSSAKSCKEDMGLKRIPFIRPTEGSRPYRRQRSCRNSQSDQWPCQAPKSYNVTLIEASRVDLIKRFVPGQLNVTLMSPGTGHRSKYV